MCSPEGQDCRICGPKAPDKPCTPDSPMTLPKDVKVTSKICSDIEDGQRAYQGICVSGSCLPLAPTLTL